MVPAFLRTLSARILLGFVVLILTFGGTIAWAVTFIHDLGEEIATIRTGYIPLTLATQDLSSTQQRLLQYLREELAGEGSPAAVQRQIKRWRKEREDRLAEIEKALDTMEGLPRGHAQWVAPRIEQLHRIEASIDGLSDDYDKLLAAPPLDRVVKTPTPGIDPAALEAAQKAQRRLISGEATIAGLISELDREDRTRVGKITQNLETNSGVLLRWTLIVGTIAIVGGILVTFWVSITLRPLARLRENARRIARGEQGTKIEERGPAEVADLAREFNSMARAIEERERELVRSERLAAVGKMAAMITHEVRNPLSSIALNVDLLGDELDGLGEGDTKEARALCRAITNEVDRLTAITEEYLAFARLPKPRLAPEPVNGVVESLARFVREDLASRGVTLETALGADLPRAMLDEAQIRQSLLNLVRNAAEALAGGGGGTVTLTTRAGADGHVEIEVADDGPGIPADAQARLFDPFFSTKEGGTGLGLALTSQIVRDHGGTIDVHSEPGAGARFVVSLPVES